MLYRFVVKVNGKSVASFKAEGDLESSTYEGIALDVASEYLNSIKAEKVKRVVVVLPPKEPLISIVI